MMVNESKLLDSPKWQVILDRSRTLSMAIALRKRLIEVEGPSVFQKKQIDHLTKQYRNETDVLRYERGNLYTREDLDFHLREMNKKISASVAAKTSNEVYANLKIIDQEMNPETFETIKKEQL